MVKFGQNWLIMASAASLYKTHRQDLGVVDPIIAASDIAATLQTIVSRTFRGQAVVTVGV